MEILSTKWIKSALLDFHRKREHKIFNSFPLISQDPTVMFINATITPFKHCFVSGEKPENYALIQRCFRIGGASELEMVGVNPYYHTFFEMFGSGAFLIDYDEAVRYLLDLLNLLTLEKGKTYFAVPDEKRFKNSLIANGVEPSKIFTLKEKDIFWQEWRFGKLGPVGKGLTVIYSRSQRKINSLKQIVKGSDEFVELANLIHVYGQETEDGSIIPAKNPGFEFAVGIERLAAVLQGCNNYQIDAILPLTQLIAQFFQNKGYSPDKAIVRTLTDHLRAICILTNEGLKPSNKMHGYALRKLIRRILENYWLTVNRISPIEPLVEQFCYQFNRCSEERISSKKVVTLVKEEAENFLTAIERGKKILKRNPSISSAILLDTYGLPQSLIPIIRKGEENEH